MARDRAGNSMRQARTVNLNNGRGVFRDKVGGFDKNDFYRFKINRSSRVSVSLSNLKANANLMIMDKNRRVVGRSTRGGRRAEKLTANLDPGTYFVRVYRRRGDTRYRLKLNSREQPSELTFTPSVEPTPTAQPISNLPQSNPLIQRVLSLTNAARRQFNLRPLRIDPTLNAVAQRHSENMAVSDFFSHVDPSGSDPGQRVAAADYGYRATAENIGAGYGTAEAVVDAWMDSPSHRANILNPYLKEIGIGYSFLAQDGGNVDYNHYWTQVFATPLS